jgi:hypothetical protein
LKNDRTRAGRKAARRYNVSPVARAVRGVLSLSAVALMVSGTGAALAKSPGAIAPAPIEHVPTERARLSHEFAPVMDLTRVGDEWTPKSVVDEGFDAFAPGFGGGDTMFASSEGDTGDMGAVADLMTVLPGTYHAGPGGVGGSDNAAVWNLTITSNTPVGFGGAPGPVTSTTGWADGIFVSSPQDITINDYSVAWLVTGATWAAGIEVEAAGAATVVANGTITATSTGDDSVAFGVFLDGSNGASITNNTTIDVNGNGARAYATGLLAASYGGDAKVTNNGAIDATGYVAIGARAYSYLGDATATNAAGDTIIAKGDGAAVGLWAYSYYGTATVDNAGTIESSGNIARGAWADGAYAVGINSGTIHAYGDAEAIGVQARGFYSADINNTGTVVASATGDAFGLHSQALGDASFTNGIGASVTATAVGGDAYGALVVGQRYSANATNFGTLDADGGEFAAGIAAIAGTTANILNEGAIDATANGAEGFAVGVIAITGGDVLVDNDGRIDATGFFATGVDVRAGGNVLVDTAYNIDVEGFDATGISASSTGENVNVTVVNSGRVYASSDTSAYGGFATGIAGVARGYLGTVTIGNSGQVLADAKYGDAQGVVASSDVGSLVFNSGMIGAFGGTSAYGVLALSADGDTIVDNDGGIVAIAMDAREGTAYAVAMQTNTGKATVTNDGAMYAIGVAQATGVYASALWDDAQITNNAMLGASGKYGNATGAIAISYTGDASVLNTYGATAQIEAMGDAGGLRAVSLYGNAHVTNYGDVTVESGGRARGLTARSVYGDGAVIVNTANVSVTGGSSAWGAWALADYYGAAYVENTGAGNITAIATSGEAIGVRAGAAYGANVTNDGLIDASGYASGIGVLAISYYGDAMVLNRAGTINAHGGAGAIGIYGVAAGVVDLTNAVDGSIHASADSGSAFGMLGYGGESKVHNEGDIIATVGSGAAFGVYAFGTATSYATNAGTIYASANNGDAVGAFSAGLHAYAINFGEIDAIGADSAIGLEAHGIDDGSGETAVGNAYNGGDIYAFATDSKYGAAMGILATSDGDTIATNGVDGTVYVRGSDAYGILAAGDVSAVADNHGDIASMSSNPTGAAFGVFVYGGDVATAGNDGTIYAGGKYAIGMASYSGTGVATAGNAAGGTVHATSYAGEAIGMNANSELGDASVANTGTVIADSMRGLATGVAAVAFGGTASAITEVDSLLRAESVYGAARGMDLLGDSTNAYNHGDIAVSAGLSAAGIVFDADTGATIVNDGTITVVQTGAQGGQYGPPALDINDGTAFGIVGYSASAASIHNIGTVDVSAYGIATGIAAYTNGLLTLDNDGHVTVQASEFASGIGGHASGGDVLITNGGAIAAAAANVAYGVQMFSDGGGLVAVTNTGAIEADANRAVGVRVDGYGAVGMSGSGDVTAHGGQSAIGIALFGDQVGIQTGGNVVGAAIDAGYGVVGVGDASVDFRNDGQIDGSASANDGFAAAAILDGAAITADNVGDMGATAQGTLGNATVFMAHGGDIDFTNDGTLTAHAGDQAFGAQLMADGTLSFTNGGDINAVSVDTALGVMAHGADVDAANTGNIAAIADVFASGIDVRGDNVSMRNFGSAFATADESASGIFALATDALDFQNGGTIDATAEGAEGDAVGLLAIGTTASVSNAGTISADATADLGTARAVIVNGDDLDFTNDGTVTATALDFAIGVATYGAANTTGNAGSIVANGGTLAIALGAYGGDVAVDNAGQVTATAADDATGVRALGVDTTFANHHAIGALAEGEEGAAIGALVAGDVTLDVDNAGTIEAMATGLYGQAIALAAYGDGDVTRANSGTAYAISTQGAAIGAVVSGYGDVAIDNSGTISAHAAGQTIGLRVVGDHAASVANSGTISAIHEVAAVALSLDAAGGTIVDNSGFITALASDAGSIAIEGFDAIEDIHNSGTITGTVDLGGGDDLFSNAEGGTWLLRGNESDFGDGDDAIVNAGTIVLENATIGLGANGEGGNSFTNTGTLVIEGDSHIDMGTGTLVAAASNGTSHAPIDVLNPLAFGNNGTISFVDGAPDDMLTIAGDFAGEGAINVDVSLLNGTSDMLYIDGNIVSSSVQTLNVALLDMITDTDGIDIPVVAVRGESAAGNVVPGSFNLGAVKWSPSNFIDLDLSINPHLDASNGDVDMFSLTVVAGGVNETGSLAASIASGAHSLLGAQVGTFRQRMGVFSQLGDSDKGAWVRVFGDKGTIDPDVRLDNLPQGGAFKFDQTNSGIEAGVNALVTDGWYVGASVGGSKGKQDLVDGFGRDDIDATTLGGYLTWVGAQGYADISYRFMDFDAEMTSAAGVQEVGGNAGAFNVEAGWNAWTSAGGMQLVPQVQYTRTTVDVDTVHGEFTDLVADGGTSSRARVGLELQQTFKSGDTTWTPYGVLSAVREMQGEQRFTIGDVFTGHTSTKGTSAQVEFGVNARIGRADIWGGLNWTDGGALDSFIGGQIGVRYTW